MPKLAMVTLLLLALPAWGQDALDTPQWRQTMRELRAAEHPWSLEVKRLSDSYGPADWPGYGAAWDYYEAVSCEESDPARSAKKYREAVETWHPYAIDLNPGQHWTHDGFWWPLMHMRLRSKLTPAEVPQWEAGLKSKAEWIMGWGTWGPNTRTGDSDLTVGHWGLVLGTDVALGTNYRTLKAANATDGTAWVGCDFAEMTAMIERCLDLADKGEWPESTAYNLTTNRTLLLSAAVAGIDRFPRIKAHLLNLGENYRWHHAPDPRFFVQWGDEERPHDLWLVHRAPTYHVIAGLGGSDQLLQIAATIQPQIDSGFYQSHDDSLLCFDPRALPAVPKIERPTGLRQSANGLLKFSTPDTLVQVFCPIPTGFDHQMSQWDIRWWRRGEWVLDSPRGYAPWSKNHNGSEGYGLQVQSEVRMLPAERTASGFKVTLETSGPQYVGGWDPPPAFTVKRTRTIAFDGNGFDVTDSGDMTEPTRLDRYLPYHKAAIEARLAPLEQFWHTPPGREAKAKAGGFDWLTKGGTPMELKTDAPIRQTEQTVIGTNIGQWVQPYEAGGYLMRLGANAAIKTRIGLAKPEPSPADVEVRGVIRGKQLILELP